MPYFPPDSRFLTEYSTSCELVQELSKKASPKDKVNLSVWIQKNGLSIQQTSFDAVYKRMDKFRK